MATKKKTIQPPCVHLYLVLDSIFREKVKRNQATYQRLDIFYCQNCLEQMENKRENVIDDKGDVPDWFDKRRSYVITDLKI